MGVATPLMATGARVRNTYATYPPPGDNPEKSGLIPHVALGRQLPYVKDSSVGDGHADD